MRWDEQQRALERAAAPALAAIEEDAARAPAWLRPLFESMGDLLFDVDLDLDRILEAAGFSDPEVWLALREEVGQPAWSYLRDGRLETAAHLLLETEMSIAEAGHLVGYGSAPTFRRQLRAFLGMPASRYRRRARRRLRQAGPPPTGGETHAYWERVLTGGLTDEEARPLAAWLGRLAPASAAGADPGREAGTPVHRSLAEGLAETLEAMAEGAVAGVVPFAEQRRLVREAVWFPDDTLFTVLGEHAARAGPERGLELARLAVDSLAGNGLLEDDPAVAALAWARLGLARWRAGDVAGARHDLERSAAESARADEAPARWRAEVGRVAAAFAWLEGRGEALELAERSVAASREARAGAGDPALAAALALRAELRAAAAVLEPGSAGARAAGLRDAVADSVEAQTLADAAPARDAGLSLRIRLLASIGSRAEIAAALESLRRAAAGREAALAPRLAWLEGHAGGDPEPRWREARERFAELGDDLWIARASLDLARLCLSEGRPGEASALFTELASTLRAVTEGAGDPLPEPLARPEPLEEPRASDLEAAERFLERLEWRRRAERALDLATAPAA